MGVTRKHMLDTLQAVAIGYGYTADGGKTWPRIRVVGTDPESPRAVETMNGRTFELSRSRGEPRGYLTATQGANGVIHLISSWNHYAFNLKWLETPPPPE